MAHSEDKFHGHLHFPPVGGAGQRPKRRRVQRAARETEVRMIEDIEKLPAELHVNRLVPHLEQGGIFHHRTIQIPKPRPDHHIPAEVTERIRLIRRKGRGIEEFGYALPARDRAGIAHQIGPIGLARVRGIAAHGDVIRMPGGRGQDPSDTPVAQNGIQCRMEMGTESPAPSIGHLPDLAQYKWYLFTSLSGF
jgi:hypothetical protein